MTVGDLIALLRQHPLDTEVLVDGYAGGYDDPVVLVKLVGERHASRPAWEGVVGEASGPEAAHGVAVVVARDEGWGGEDEFPTVEAARAALAARHVHQR